MFCIAFSSARAFDCSVVLDNEVDITARSCLADAPLIGGRSFRLLRALGMREDALMDAVLIALEGVGHFAHVVASGSVQLVLILWHLAVFLRGSFVHLIAFIILEDGRVNLGWLAFGGDGSDHGSNDGKFHFYF